MNTNDEFILCVFRSTCNRIISCVQCDFWALKEGMVTLKLIILMKDNHGQPM